MSKIVRNFALSNKKNRDFQPNHSLSFSGISLPLSFPYDNTFSFIQIINSNKINYGKHSNPHRKL